MEDGFSLRDSTVGIVGLGLMGGSLAMSLKGKCGHIIGFETHHPTLEQAHSRGIIDHARPDLQSLSREKKEVDLLILATPVPTIIEILQRLPSTIRHPCIVMDIGSTKRDILQAMSGLPGNFDPIGGHPICGKEKLGLDHAEVNLYRNAPFVVTPLERTSNRSKSAARQVISAIGANCLEMTAGEHDRILASTSHLPFLISSSFARSTPREYASLIGPGFRSASRLADTPSQMMMGILQSNRDNIIGAIKTFRESLNAIESALQMEDYPQLEMILDQSRATYRSMTNIDY